MKKECEEILRVGIVGDPAEAEERRLARIGGLDERAPVQLLEDDGDPCLLQVFLDHLGDEGVVTLVVEPQIDRWQPVSAGIARLEEELGGTFEVLLKSGAARVVTRHPRRDDAVGRIEASLEENLAEELTVDRPVDRFAQLSGAVTHTGVGGAFLLEVETVVLHRK